MKKVIRIGFSGTAACALALTAMSAVAETPRNGSVFTLADLTAPEGGVSAPDVWVCTLPGVAYWGSSSDIHAFSVATTSANAGNVNLNWIQNSTQHPVISQNMYRLKNGALEQVGQSWVKHGFCALQQNLPGCGVCPGGGGCLSILQPGCADPYSTSLNGNSSLLGPRSEVNPSTGAFLWPHSVASGSFPTVIRSRLQVHDADIRPNLNPGARWFVEGQYVHPQDAQANLDNNNASYVEINIQNFSFTGPSNVSLLGPTHGMTAAIEGWPTLTPSAKIVDLELPGEGGGRIIVGYNATDNGNGTWHYEYAIFNMNVDRAVGAFSVPVPTGVTLTNIGFHDVDYHSGEPYDGTDWPATVSGGSITWATAPVAVNPNANAIRWSTMYNFRFDANAAPGMADSSLGMFKTGSPASITASVAAPGSAACAGDLNGDDTIDGSDLASLLASWGSAAASPADLNGDGVVNGADLAGLLSGWGACP